MVSHLRVALVVLAVISVFLPPVPVARAFDVTVNTLDDLPEIMAAGVTCRASGFRCTLRAAIQWSNEVGGANRIRLPNGHYRLAFGEIQISSDVRLGRASVTDSVTLDASGYSRIFSIASGATVEMAFLRFRGGDAGSGDGGAIANAGSLTLRDVEFEENKADGRGGALLNRSAGRVELVTGLFRQNSGAAGGAIANEGTMTVTTGRFERNYGPTAGSRGGAVFNAGTLTLNGTSIQNGEAELGGGVYNADGGRLTIAASSSLTGNTALNGGAIVNAAGATLRLDATRIGPDNAARDAGTGGGLYNEGTAEAFNVGFEENRAGRGGGGAVTNRGDLTVTFGRFERNQAVGSTATTDGSGGAIRNEKNLGISRSRFVENKTDRDGDGGAIHNRLNQASLIVSDTTFTDNRASRGGAIHSAHARGLRIENSQVVGNRAGVGGGIAVYGPSTEPTSLRGVTFRDNRAGEHGGAGGGVHMADGADVSLQDSTLESNRSDEGGGISVYSGHFSLNTSTLRENRANSDGGGLLLRGEVQIDAVTFVANEAGVNGGAIAVIEGRSADIVNSTFSANRAARLGGAILDTGVARLNAVTLHGNRANAGGAIANRSETQVTKVRLSILADSPSGGNCSGRIDSLGYNLETTDVCGFRSGGDLVNVDPRLAPLADNGGPTPTFALRAGSPAVDAGPAGTPCPLQDQRGRPRPQDGNGDGSTLCDIGAYERQPGDSIQPTPPSGKRTPTPTPFGDKTPTTTPDNGKTPTATKQPQG